MCTTRPSDGVPSGPRQQLPSRRMLMAVSLEGKGNRQATTWATCILPASDNRGVSRAHVLAGGLSRTGCRFVRIAFVSDGSPGEHP